MARAFVGIGGNLGDAAATVRSAIAQLAALDDCALVAASSLYRTAPVDAGGPDYVNAVVELETALAPHALLALLQRLERLAGRERPYRNAPRTLDLDLLLVDDAQLATPDLTLPHPRMHERAFVLVPLAEIAPQRVSRDALAAVSGQAIQRL